MELNSWKEKLYNLSGAYMIVKVPARGATRNFLK